MMPDKLYLFYYSYYDEAYVLHQEVLPNLSSAIGIARRMKIKGTVYIWVVEANVVYEEAIVARDSYPLSETAERELGDIVRIGATEYIVYRQPVRVEVNWLEWLDENED